MYIRFKKRMENEGHFNEEWKKEGHEKNPSVRNSMIFNRTQKLVYASHFDIIFMINGS